MNLRGVTRYDPGSAPLAPGAPVPYAFMSQPSMSGVHVPTLLKVVRRRKRRKKKRDKDLTKHMGPGAHPSGTEQDVHGRGRMGRDPSVRGVPNKKERNYLRGVATDLVRQEQEAVDVVQREGGADNYDRFVDLRTRREETEARLGNRIRNDETATPPRSTGSLSPPQVNAVHNRLSVIAGTRRRLLEQLGDLEAIPVNRQDAETLDRISMLQQDLSDLYDEEGELLVALTTPTLPGISPSPPGLDIPEPKTVSSASGKKAGIIYDRTKADDPSDAYAIFEAELEVDGERFEAVVDQVADRDYGGVELHGFIQDGDGLQVGKFSRTLAPREGAVYNNEFYIDENWQGKGIGTMFLAHWEDELRATGYDRMQVTAADVGRYAWAVAGYSFDYQYDEIMDNLLHYVQVHNADVGLPAEHYDFVESDEPMFNDARRMVSDWSLYNEAPEPYEIAMLGAGDSWHLGKEVLLSDGMWSGVKYLR